MKLPRILLILFSAAVAIAQPIRVVNGPTFTPSTIAGWSLDGEPRAVPYDLATGGQLVFVTNGSTAANQTTSNTLLSSLDAKMPGQINGAIPVTSQGITVTGPAAVTATTNNALTTDGSAINTATYQSGFLQINSTATSGTWIAEQSVDGVNWVACPLIESSVANPAPVVAAVTATATTRMFRFSNLAPLFRLRIASALNNTGLTALATFSPTPYAAPIVVVTQPTGSSLNAQVTGAASQGATATGNPVFTGGVAKTAQPTARTDGQVVAPLFDKVGRPIVNFDQVRDLVDSNAPVTLTATTETTLVAAVASTFNDMQWVHVASTANYTGTPTGVRLDFRDSTAGTVRFSVALPATGGAFNYTLPLGGQNSKQTTANTAWTVQLVFIGGTSPAITNGDIRVTPQTVRKN